MNRPNNNEIEISLFGPGYGEAIALHIGNNKWILIDSCINGTTKKPLSLEYLSLIGVDVKESVVMVAATHWHDDHIKGLSEIYNSCSNACFVFSNALIQQEYLKLFTIYGEKKPSIAGSGVDEFSEIFRVIEERNNFKVASQDTLLLSEEVIIDDEILQVLIYALSPTSMTTFRSIIASQTTSLEESGPTKRVPSPTPNYTSVVLLICIGEDYILLGADMESSNNNYGWNKIINSSSAIKKYNKSIGVYKVAHHGSKSSDNELIWHGLLIDNPYSLVSPFKSGRHLIPSVEDIDRINALTEKAYITKSLYKKKYRWNNGVVMDLFSEVTCNAYNVYDGPGKLTLKKTLGKRSVDWNVTTYGGACHMKDINI